MNLSKSASTSKRKKRALATAVVCTMQMVMPGCRIPHLRCAEPPQELPDTFNGVISDDNSAQIGIDEFFNDPTLTSLIYEGLTGNQELKILAEDIQIANNAVLARRGAIFPFVTFGGRAGLEKPSMFTPMGAVEDQLNFRPGQGFPSPLPNFLFGANLTWQVDIWRQLRNSRDAAALRYLGTTEGRNYVITRLVAEIAENYYGLMSLDKRLENLDNTIALQTRSLEIAKANKEGARGTELPVQRFMAEVSKNESEKLIVNQEIIEVENRINFLLGRYPQPVPRMSADFFELTLHPLSLGMPVQLLMNRPDIRQSERELEASGLDVKVARANFYPKLNLTAGVGYEAFNPKYLVITPESLIYNAVGDLIAPVINRSAVKAEYMTANAEQLQAVYKYQQVVLNAFTEVINHVSRVENYTKSIEIKKQQLASLNASVDAASKLFNATRIEYLDVLFAQRDLMEARMVLIETKREQLGAVVNTYQALGGGLVPPEFLDWRYLPTEPILPEQMIPVEEGPALAPAAANPAMVPPAADPAIVQPAAVPALVPPAAVPNAGNQ